MTSPSSDGQGQAERASMVRLLATWPVVIVGAMVVGLMSAKLFGADVNVPGVILLAVICVAIVGIFGVGVFVFIRDRDTPPYD